MLIPASRLFPRRACAAAVLLAAAWVPARSAVDVRINFQPAASPVPAGYLPDAGLPFDSTRGYGWVTEASLALPNAGHVPIDLGPNTRDRARPGIDPLQNTLCHMQYPPSISNATAIKVPSAWEYVLPPGAYEVVASVGDQPHYDSRHVLRAEGVAFIDGFVSTPEQEYRVDSAVVQVTDGRLTLDAIGGTNTKLNYVRIRSLEAPAHDGRLRLENRDGLPFDDRLVFSRIARGLYQNMKFHERSVLRIHNDGTGTLTLTDLRLTAPGKWILPNGDTNALPIRIPAGAYYDVAVQFIETAGTKGPRFGELVIRSDDANAPETRVQLAGAFMERPEGGWEVSTPDILSVFGWDIRVLFAGQSLATPYLLAGDEMQSHFWIRADSSRPVAIRQLAAYHRCCVFEAWAHLDGIGGGNFRHVNVNGQTLLPAKGDTDPADGIPAASTYDTYGPFSFLIEGYTDEPSPEGNRGVRYWAVRDRAGALMPNTYFVMMDYVGPGANFDFNDNLYLVQNIRPLSPAVDPAVPAPAPGSPSLALAFDRTYPDSGSLKDKDSLGIGFRGFLRNKLDRLNAVDGYRPALLGLDTAAGNLYVTPAPGTLAGSANTQANALLLPFDGGQAPFRIRTTVIGPLDGPATAGRQAGAMFGIDPDDYVALVAGVKDSAGLTVSFQSEAAGALTRVSEAALARPEDLDSLELALLGNPSTGSVTAAYRAFYRTLAPGAARWVVLPDSVTLTGTLRSRCFDRRASAGLLASQAAGAPLPIGFSAFAVDLPPAPVPDPDTTGQDTTRTDTTGTVTPPDTTRTDTTGTVTPPDTTQTDTSGTVTPPSDTTGTVTPPDTTQTDTTGSVTPPSDTTQTDTTGSVTPPSDTTHTDTTGTVTPPDTTHGDSTGTDSTGQFPVDIRLNFQPEASLVPAGYAADFGAPYDSASGRGWIRESDLGTDAPAPLDLRPNTSDLPRDGIDPLYATSIHMQYPDTGSDPYRVRVNGAFEYRLPNGNYKVVVGVGEAAGAAGGSAPSARHSIRVEGVPLITGFVSSTGSEYRVDSLIVQVADGRLTIDARGGENTQLCFLRIAATDSAPTPFPVDVSVNFQDSATATPAGFLRDFGQPFGPHAVAGAGKTLAYGWVAPGTSSPLDLSRGGSTPGNGRNRHLPEDASLATFVHMQGSDVNAFDGTPLAGSWEIALPPNWYTVTVGVGDARYFNSVHRIAIEGKTAIDGFRPTAENPFFAATRVVHVTDGRLTLDAAGGNNTKIDYVRIRSSEPDSGRPSVSRFTPAMDELDVPLDIGLTAELNLPNGNLNAKTLTDSTVRLYRSQDNARVAVRLNTSGGGDVIAAQPVSPLDPNQGYRLEVDAGVQDRVGKRFLPASTSFTTGNHLAFATTREAFEKVSLGAAASGYPFSSLVVGPDSLLYAGTLSGHILRFPLLPDGTVGTPTVITSVIQANGNAARIIIGMAFDPASTPQEPILWITNNAPTLTNSPDWSGKISRLSGPDLSVVQDYVTGLPRATLDHMSNSLAFGPDGDLYMTQGSRSALGGFDGTWKGEEHLLNAAVLRLHPAAITAPPLDVKTEDGGTYDPYAPGAPLTLYATGVRNAFDLVWHSNGSLYVAGNSSSAGGTTPTSPAALPAACADRIDSARFGAYTGPAITGFANAPLAQPDLLYRVEAGKYYGHPNPRRCEWVLNGGNPTSGTDPLEETLYPVGTLPDRNWQPPAHVFGMHFSPDGALEYRSGAFGGSLKGKLMVVRYSTGKDVLVLDVDPATGAITGTSLLNIGGSKFADPLDIVENPANGFLYVSEYAGNKISLLRPK